jgi:sulfite oxidase
VPKDQVSELLDEMHIGWLDPADVASEKKARSADDPYKDEPARHPALVSISEVPCSAETPREMILDEWLTPAPLWFVRNHHPVRLGGAGGGAGRGGRGGLRSEGW